MNDQHDGLGFDSRRTVLKKGGVLAGVGLGVHRGGVASQAGPIPVGKAFMFSDEYRPGARFRVVSPVIEESPDVGAIQDQDVWSEADTRVIEYLNTGERVSFFPIEQADVQRGTVYEFSPGTLSLFDRDEGIVSCEYHFPAANADPGQLRTDDTEDGGGEALIAANNFYPGARFRIISGVIGWTPAGDPGGTDPYSGYATRYGEYLNANDEFLLYPAESAAVEHGDVYRMPGDFEAVATEDRLFAVEFDRVAGSGENGGTRRS